MISQQSSSSGNGKSPVPLLIVWVVTLCLSFLLGRTSLSLTPVPLRELSLRRGGSITAAPASASATTKNHQDTDDGWHSIEVFYGNTSHLDAVRPPQYPRGVAHGQPRALQDWYSQADQDQTVAKLFQYKTDGYFVDLAANDARTISNTFALERRFQWKGLCVEPNPSYWYDLSYRDCQVVGAVVGKHRMEPVEFQFNLGAGGGIVGDQFDVQQAQAEEAKPKFTVPLLEILERFNAPRVIDYLSLDVEGAEEYIMTIFPLEQYQIKVMTVERPKPGLVDFLQQNGFTKLKDLSAWGETLWIHQDFSNELDVASVQQ